jgi:molecular chaperone DnaJ
MDSIRIIPKYNSSDIFEGFDNVFDVFFGKVSSKKQTNKNFEKNAPRKGKDIKYDLAITLEESIAGKQIELEIPQEEICSLCKGTGTKQGSTRKICSECKGTGYTTKTQNFLNIKYTCPKCNGSGVEISSPCVKCNGKGTTVTIKKITLNIPLA